MCLILAQGINSQLSCSICALISLSLLISIILMRMLCARTLNVRICTVVLLPMRWAQLSANCCSALTSLLLAVLMLRSPLFSQLDKTIFTLTMFLLLLCLIARQTCILRLLGFIALRLCTVRGSLIFIITLRYVCADSCLTLCALYVPASRTPLAAAAAQLISPFACSCSLLFLISRAISSVALPTSIASLAAALASSTMLLFCCIFVADYYTSSIVDLRSYLIQLKVRAVLSAIALALVCATLSASLRLLRLGECCVFSTNVNAPQIMLLTISASRGCQPLLRLIKDSTSRRKALRLVACSSIRISQVDLQSYSVAIAPQQQQALLLSAGQLKAVSSRRFARVILR